MICMLGHPKAYINLDKPEINEWVDKDLLL